MSETATATKLSDLVEAAVATVAQLEALKPGAWTADERRHGTAAPWDAAQVQAERAVEALHSAAVAELFPPVIGTADAVRLLEFHTAATGWHPDAIAALHNEAAEAGNDDLACLIRSEAVLQRVAREGSVGRADQQAELVGLIAAQLTGNDDFEPAASIIVEPAPALRDRINTAVKRCAAEAEHRARFELAAWYRERAGGTFRAGLSRRTYGLDAELRDDQIRGAELAALIENGDVRAFDHGAHLHEHHPQGGGHSSQGHALFSVR